MSADPTLFVNGEYIGVIGVKDWKAFVEQNYPGAAYELKDGYKVLVTVKVKSAFERLVDDIREANEAASIAVQNIGDGGSANLDSVFLRLKGWRESKAIEAIKKAGLYCRAKRRWIGEGYMITPTSAGQGISREKSVEVMAKTLKERGWDVLTYYQMD